MSVPPDVPSVPVASGRRSFLDRLSAVWLVPLMALVAAGAFAWRSAADTGPLIEIAFADAEGVETRETELRYRDVAVGVVERVHFTSGLDQVIVSVRLNPELAPYVDEGAQFWVVRPEITAQRITGLQTVLSGVYIEGIWDNVAGEPLDRWQGQDAAPLAAGAEGLRFSLRATDGSLTSAMPLLYQGVTVGEVGAPVIGDDGVSVTAEAVILAPYDRLVTEATTFWDASGFDITLGTAGADVDFDSLSSLLIGGLAFDTFVSGARPAEDGAVFQAFIDEDAARDSIFVAEDAPVLELMAVFDANFAGLAVGAAVELDGLRVGEVTAVSGVLDEARFGDARVRLQTALAIQPARLGLEGETGRDAILATLDARVAQGLRARLVTGSLLGGLKVQLVTVEGGDPDAAIDRSTLPFFSIPITDSDVTDVAASAAGTLSRIDNLPVEQLLDSAVAFLDNASLLVGSAETQAVPAAVSALLGDIRGIVGAPEVQALPGQVAGTLGTIDAAAAEARDLLAAIEEAQAVDRVLAAVDRAGDAADRIGVATAGVPALVDRLTAVAARTEGLPLDALVAELTLLATEGRALIDSPGVQAVPGQVGALAAEGQAALADARALLGDIDAAGLSARLDATLASAERAASSIDTAADGLPALVARLDALVADVDTLPLDALVAEVTGLAASAQALVGSPSAQALPADLSATLSEAEALLREAREGGVVANANAALEAARRAADALPDLVARAGLLIDQAGVTVAGFGDSGDVVSEAERAIREVAAAAEAVADLARAIERDPSSLIFGD